MRSVSFKFLRERMGRVWRARAAALDVAPAPEDGRPLPSDIAEMLLAALDRHGPDMGPLEFADEWLSRPPCHWHEYGVAMENLRLGILPPTSGRFNNDAYGECTGGVFRADVWGLIHPADPAEAAARAAEDARIEHFGAAVDTACFLAAVVAESFTTTELRACLRAGLGQLRSGSRAAVCVEKALAAAHRWPDWRRGWAEVAADRGHPEPTNALLNLAGLVFALEAGGLDWPRTIDIVRATGGDVCAKATAVATVLAVLGSEIEPPRRRTAASARALPAAGAADESAPEDVFVDKLCQLAVACAGPGVVEIAGAPYLPMPGPPVAPPERLVARYEGVPVLAPGQERGVFLERAGGPDDIPGALELTAPEGLDVRTLGAVAVPGKIAARAVNVTMSGGTDRPGIVSAQVTRAGRTVAEARFGFRRAARYVAMGPFDNSDGGGLDRAYLPETRLGEEMEQGRTPFHTSTLVVSGDRVDVDAAFGALGPWVIYLLRAVNSPSARDVTLRVGASDGVKLWLNGRKLLADDRRRFSTPNDFALPARLRKGENLVAIKLARCGRRSDFRMRITERDSEEAALDLWDPF